MASRSFRLDRLDRFAPVPIMTKLAGVVATLRGLIISPGTVLPKWHRIRMHAVSQAFRPDVRLESLTDTGAIPVAGPRSPSLFDVSRIVVGSSRIARANEGNDV